MPDYTSFYTIGRLKTLAIIKTCNNDKINVLCLPQAQWTAEINESFIKDMLGTIHNSIICAYAYVLLDGTKNEIYNDLTYGTDGNTCVSQFAIELNTIITHNYYFEDESVINCTNDLNEPIRIMRISISKRQPTNTDLHDKLVNIVRTICTNSNSCKKTW